MKRNIGVFCSSYDEMDNIFSDDAIKLGRWIGESGQTLIYGGTKLGLMELMASEVKKYGGKAIGVVTNEIAELGLTSLIPDKLETVKSLSERKDKIIELADILIVMPGGFGTLDEAFTTIASRKMGYHNKDVIFCNTGGIFDNLFSLFDTLYKQRFASNSYLNYYTVLNNATDCIEYLKQDNYGL